MRTNRFRLFLFFSFSLSYMHGWAQKDLVEQLKHHIYEKAATLGEAVI